MRSSLTTLGRRLIREMAGRNEALLVREAVSMNDRVARGTRAVMAGPFLGGSFAIQGTLC